MEAKDFGFGRMAPAFKFDPTDADIVAHYLLPRALNLPNPYEHAIIEDPGSTPPWEVLERHGDLDHAFFFRPPADPSRNGGRKSRTGQDGTWQGQNSVEDNVTLLRPGGGEVNIRYRRYNLSFCLGKDKRSTGYVMHEYEIISPPLPGTVLSHIKVSNKLKKERAAAAAAAAAEQQVPEPEHPGAIYEYDAAAAAGMNNGEEFAGTHDSAPYVGGMLENAGYHIPLRYAHPEPEVEYGNNNFCVSIPDPDQPGPSYNYDAAAIKSEGFAAGQAETIYGGGLVDNAGAYLYPSGYVPAGYGADNSNYICEYQQWKRPRYYQAGDAAVVSAGGEVFSGEQQAGAPCDNSGNGTVVGTETSAHSATSLCGEGKVDFHGTSLYSMMLFGGDNFKCEQNNGGDPANGPHY